MSSTTYTDFVGPAVNAAWLNAVNNATYNGTGTFLQTGTGAVSRTAAQKFSDTISVKDFGATGNGSTDDTAAIQAAINAYQGTGAALYFPRGTYLVAAGGLTVTATIGFIGETRYGCTIQYTTTTGTLFSVATDSQVRFEKLTFTGPVGSTSGSTISLTGAATQNEFSTIAECNFQQGYIPVLTTNASDWLITNCVFSQYASYGVFVQDTYNGDAGDSEISGNCTFGGATGSTAIGQASSGGLKIIGNKLIGGSYGYRMVLTSSVVLVTGDLLMLGNSIENQAVAGVSLNRFSGTSTFQEVVIVGNQFAGSPNSIQTDGNAGWLSMVTVVGNQCSLAAGNGTCITIGAASNFFVGGNQLTMQSGTCYGIAIGTNATNGKIGPNQYEGGFTARISNGNPASVFNADLSLVANAPASGTVTCSTADGVLYTGNTTVTFTTAFDSIPKVDCTPGTVGGGIAAWATNVTKTGFTMIVFSVTNGGSGVPTWTAVGTI